MSKVTCHLMDNVAIFAANSFGGLWWVFHVRLIISANPLIAFGLVEAVPS